MNLPFARVIILCLSVSASCFLARAETSSMPPAASATAKTQDPDPITLPAYNVITERLVPPMKNWRYASVPGYEILSDLSDHNTKAFVDDFYRLREVSQIIMPGSETSTLVPTTIILCTSRKDFEHFLPKEQYAAARENPTENNLFKSTFVHDTERAAIVVDFSYLENKSDTDFSDTNEPFKSFYLEYFRQRMRSTMKKVPPLWLEEGLAQIYADVDFDNKSILLGGVESPQRGYAPGQHFPFPRNHIWSEQTAGKGPFTHPGDFNVGVSPGPSALSTASPGNTGFPSLGGGFTRMYSLQQGSIIPMEIFFRWEHLTRKEKAKFNPSFSPQAYLFSHICIYGRAHRYQTAYYKLAEYAANAPVTEEVFKKFFGLTFKKMEIEMRGYLDFTDYEKVKFRIKNGGFDDPPPSQLREATDAESGRIAGEFLRLAGHREEALNRLVAPYVRGSREPELLAALGLAEAEVNHRERARKFLEIACKNKTVRARALLELAKLRLAEAKAKASIQNRPLLPTEIKQVQEPLLRGATCPPALKELCETLALLWYENDTQVSEQEFDLLLSNAVEFQRNLKLVYLVCAVGLKQNFPEKIRPLLTAALASAPNADTKKALAALAAKLPPVPVSK